MSTKIYTISNLEKRSVTFRGMSGQSYHLRPLEVGREIRALEIDNNEVCENLQHRRVLAIEKRDGNAKVISKKSKTTANEKS